MHSKAPQGGGCLSLIVCEHMKTSYVDSLCPHSLIFVCLISLSTCVFLSPVIIANMLRSVLWLTPWSWRGILGRIGRGRMCNVSLSSWAPHFHKHLPLILAQTTHREIQMHSHTQTHKMTTLHIFFFRWRAGRRLVASWPEMAVTPTRLDISEEFCVY